MWTNLLKKQKKGARKEAETEITIRKNGKELYSGPLRDLPLREKIIIEKSIQFFDDPEPCHIHRTAVRIRLLAELDEALKETEPDSCELLFEYGDF